MNIEQDKAFKMLVQRSMFICHVSLGDRLATVPITANSPPSDGATVSRMESSI